MTDMRFRSSPDGTVWASAAVMPEFESQTWTFTVPIYDGRLMAYGTCYHSYQCCGLVTFWYGSASGRGSVPYLCLTDPDAGGQKTYGSGTLLKSHKEVTEEYRYRRNQGSYYFYLMMKKDPDVTNGSGCGSWRPKTYVSYESGSTTLIPTTARQTHASQQCWMRFT